MDCFEVGLLEQTSDFQVMSKPDPLPKSSLLIPQRQNVAFMSKGEVSEKQEIPSQLQT